MSAQNAARIRVAIVYNATNTGERHRDGMLSILDTSDIVRIRTISYSKPEQGLNTIKNLILNDSVDVILGPTESEVFKNIYTIDSITDNKISVISGLATTDIGNDSQGFFFRINLEANERVYEMWSYINKFWVSKIALVYEDSEFGRNAEMAFRKLIHDFNSGVKYKGIPFKPPLRDRADILDLQANRYEVIGLICEREDVEKIYNEILDSDHKQAPYHPYFFSIIDVSSVGEGLKKFYFPSLQVYQTGDSIKFIQHDEVYILGQETALLLLKAIEKSGESTVFKTRKGRTKLRNQIVGVLEGEDNVEMNMNFRKMKNIGPTYLYNADKKVLQSIDQKKDINWFSMLGSKMKLVYSVHSFNLLLSMFIMLVIVFSMSWIEIRRSFPKKHVKIWKTWVFYLYFFVHLSLVLFLYIYLAESGSINYSDILMVIIISITPAAFFKTTFFETRSGKSVGMEDIYKRILASVDKEIMKARYDKLDSLVNLIAYSNSEDSMRKALKRIYRNNPSSTNAAKLIQKLEEDLSSEKDYMNRKRVVARLIMRQFNRDQLKAEGFVPTNWDYDDDIDPVILIRHAAKYCSNDMEISRKVDELLITEKDKLKKRNRERYKEMIVVHNKELEEKLSNEGITLVKLRFLMVLHGFRLEWLLKEGIITEALLEDVRISARKAKGQNNKN